MSAAERPQGAAAAVLHLIAAAVYTLLAAVATWPLATRLASSLPIGSGHSGTVPLVSAWSLWWTADRASHGFAGLWDAPIFHPAAASFAFQETILLGGILTAPLQWLGGTPALAHNVFLLGSLVANGSLAFALLRRLRVEAWAAGLGGAAVVMLPYVHYELGVLTLVPLWGLLWMLCALLRLAESPSLSGGVSLGLAAAATALMCAHYALFAMLLFGPAAAWLFAAKLRDATLWRAVAAAAGVALLIAGPIAWIQLRTADVYDFERPLQRAQAGSASLDGWRQVPWQQAIPFPGVTETTDPEVMALFPGTAMVVLGLLGLTAMLMRKGRRRAFAAIALVGGTGFVLSMLPRMEVGGFAPYAVLQEWVPGLSQARSLWRAGLFAQLALALGSAAALPWIVDAVAQRAAPPVARRAALVVACALGCLVALEVWPAPQRLYTVPAAADYRDFSRWLRENMPEDAALLNLPLPKVPAVAAFEPTADWMYATAYHRQPLAVGYSSFVPASVTQLVRALGGCPGAEAYRRLAKRQRFWLVVDAIWAERQPDCAPSEPAWAAVYRDPTLDVVVYRRNEAAVTPRADTPSL